MGVYITQSDLETPVGGAAVLVELADLDDDAAVDAPVIAQVIERAEGMVNGFLGQRFSVPVLATSNLIKDMCLDIACYYLAQARGISDLEVWSRRYDKAIDKLQRVAVGTMQLDVAEKPTGSELVASSNTGMVDVADHEDGGPLWGEDWRDESEWIPPWYDDWT